ncbi:MAG: DNA-binding protein [Verrucomicrobia bacterium]|nr:DNA-binding protein [Verrucomicrobiota bacterium]
MIPQLTADDLVKVNRSILVEALRYQGIVFKVKEMAQLASCDTETIRRKTKDGTLRKVPGIRHIRVHFDVFFAWLRAERK